MLCTCLRPGCFACQSPVGTSAILHPKRGRRLPWAVAMATRHPALFLTGSHVFVHFKEAFPVQSLTSHFHGVPVIPHLSPSLNLHIRPGGCKLLASEQKDLCLLSANDNSGKGVLTEKAVAGRKVEFTQAKRRQAAAFHLVLWEGGSLREAAAEAWGLAL